MEIRSWRGQRDTWGESWHCRGDSAETAFVTLKNGIKSGLILYRNREAPMRCRRIGADLERGKDRKPAGTSPAEGRLWRSQPGRGNSCWRRDGVSCPKVPFGGGKGAGRDQFCPQTALPLLPPIAMRPCSISCFFPLVLQLLPSLFSFFHCLCFSFFFSFSSFLLPGFYL